MDRMKLHKSEHFQIDIDTFLTYICKL